ncbi:RNA polymerase sigma factor [Snuella sedimenti]|uniref:Sigma-70 family RNA polymerase sigma factor n=1 Tax=Snuella sedimenti TaxID=2798802 RepID=A0A8J7IPK1_9FLAO|nr:sigma-70 family RNA polymerase sigma factor [Snuella sedimenti]MBJ6368592.1 sigma-70 family RNA polymerase sigma factor [Snuella sedimenti]
MIEGTKHLRNNTFVNDNVPNCDDSTYIKHQEGISDHQVWHRLKEGDEYAFALIYKSNFHFLYSYGLKLVYDKALVRDSIQDLFVHIWDRKHKLGEVANIRMYLCKALRRRVLNERKKGLKLVNTSSIQQSDTLVFSESVEHRLIEKQKFDYKLSKLKVCVNRLTTKQREMIHLKFYVGLNYKEIAEIMDLSTKATYKLMGRAIGALRHFYK